MDCFNINWAHASLTALVLPERMHHWLLLMLPQRMHHGLLLMLPERMHAGQPCRRGRSRGSGAPDAPTLLMPHRNRSKKTPSHPHSEVNISNAIIYINRFYFMQEKCKFNHVKWWKMHNKNVKITCIRSQQKKSLEYFWLYTCMKFAMNNILLF